MTSTTILPPPVAPVGAAPALETFDLRQGLDRVARASTVLIYMHDNPDPDALAAALGLKRLVEQASGARATLALGGIVGRAENRAMVDILRIPLTPVEDLSPASF